MKVYTQFSRPLKATPEIIVGGTLRGGGQHSRLLAPMDLGAYSRLFCASSRTYFECASAIGLFQAGQWLLRDFLFSFYLAFFLFSPWGYSKCDLELDNDSTVCTTMDSIRQHDL